MPFSTEKTLPISFDCFDTLYGYFVIEGEGGTILDLCGVCACLSIYIINLSNGVFGCIWWCLGEAPVLVYEIELYFDGFHIIFQPIKLSNLISIKYFLLY